MRPQFNGASCESATTPHRKPPRLSRVKPPRTRFELGETLKHGQPQVTAQTALFEPARGCLNVGTFVQNGLAPAGEQARPNRAPKRVGLARRPAWSPGHSVVGPVRVGFPSLREPASKSPPLPRVRAFPFFTGRACAGDSSGPGQTA